MLVVKKGKIFPMETYKTAKTYDHNGDLSKRWYVFYYFKNPQTGKYDRFREMISGTLKTKSDRYLKAKEIQDLINKRLRDGFNPFSDSDPKQINILKAIEIILASKNDLRKSSKVQYKSVAKAFTDYLQDPVIGLSKLTIEEFNFHHARNFLDYHRKKNNLSALSTNNIFKVIKVFFNIMVEREWILTNPFKKIKSLPTIETEFKAFSDDELKIIREQLPEYDFNLFIIANLIYYCFLRPQEIIRLRIYNLHLDQGYIDVPANISKTKKSCTVNIPDPFKEDLNKLDLNFPKTNLIFSYKLERGLHEIGSSTLGNHWRKFTKTVGITHSLYALKHTGNGKAVESGISVRDLQLHNRHSNLSMTQRYLDRFSKQPTNKIVTNFPTL